MAAKKKAETAKVSSKNTNVNTAVPKAEVPESKDFFQGLGKNAKWVALGVILLIGIIVFKDFLLLNKVYFFKDIGSDTLNFSYPFVHNVADYISKYGVPKWSFNFGIGQSLFPFFLRDPFDILLYIGGKDHIYYLMGYLEFLKIVLGGYIFFHYLKAVKLSDYTAIIGGALFSFTGFMIVGSGWFIFSFEALNMALLLLAFERLFQQRKWMLFVLAIAFICISQPFNLFVYGVFFITYVLLRLFQTHSFNGKVALPLFGWIIGLGVLALLISGPFMLENVVQLLESPRGSGNTSYADLFMHAPMFARPEIAELGTYILRFFSSDILGTGNDFKGAMNTLEAPMSYCGLISLVLMPQVFQFLDKKVKIPFIVMIVLWLMPILFPYFRYAYWLFTGNYFRAYSLVSSFFLMYYSLIALDKIIERRKVNLLVLAVTIVILLALLNYPYFPEDIVTHSISLFVSVMIVAYGVLLFLMSRPNSPVYLRYIFMGAVVFELIYLSNISVNDRDTMAASEIMSKTKGYNDYTMEAVNYIHNIDKGFYRIDKVYASSPAMHFSINDGMAQGYMGTSGYSPFNEISYILYLQLVGISHKENELQSRWAVGVAYRPILETENQVKYLLAKGPVSPISRTASDSLTSFGDVRIYKNKYFLPLGYTFNTFIRESVFNSLSNDQKDYESLRACVVADSQLQLVQGLKEFQLKDTIQTFSFQLYKDYTDALRKDTLSLTQFGETEIKGIANVSEDKVMYLSIPYDKGWTLKVDGHPQEKLVLSAGMTGVMLKKGTHTVEMTYELRFFKQGVILSIIGIALFAGLWYYLRKKEAAPGKE